ncbi:MAG: type III secretion system gatekeeper subunit SctW [Gammaproteobacteria bacterium]|nr:type III secretion system gatekeeper subunit SctW [Gammaproteobacteria bacterium]
MSANIVNPAVIGKAPPPGGAQTEAPGQPLISEFKGKQAALLPDAKAVLADAMEELTFSFSEVTQKKEIAERNLRSGVKSFAMEQAQKYLEQVPDLNDDGALREWMAEVEQMPQSTRAEALLKQVQERFQDPSHAFLALSLAADMAEHGDPDSELAANAAKAKAAWYEQHSDAIDAGINISPEANKAAYAGLGGPQQLRDGYREVVLDYSSIGDAYDKIIARFPGKSLPQAISFMMASLSADIHANQHSSARSVVLQGIVNDLSQVKQLNTLYQSCHDLLERCHNLFASKPAGEAGLVERMLAFVIELKDAEWRGDEVIGQALDHTGLSEPEGNIYFLQGFKEVARLIPLKIFEDANQRDRMLESVQQRIDREIDYEAELE